VQDDEPGHHCDVPTGPARSMGLGISSPMVDRWCKLLRGSGTMRRGQYPRMIGRSIRHSRPVATHQHPPGRPERLLHLGVAAQAPQAEDQLVNLGLDSVQLPVVTAGG
jgi:hypothetical protein